MGSCERYRQDISAYIDGQLSEDGKKALMAHLKACPACQAYYEDLLAIHKALSPVETEACPAPPDLARRAAALAQFIPQERRDGKKRPAWARPAALAACCAIAALGIWGYILARPGVMLTANSAPSAQSEDAGDRESMEAQIVTGDAAEDKGEMDEAAGYSAAEPSAAPGNGMGKSVFQDTGADMPGNGAAAGRDNYANDAAADGGDAAVEASHTQDAAFCALSVSCGDAGPWLMERLGVACAPGDTLELTAMEYGELLQFLDDSGADYTETPADVGFFVTIT